MPRAGAMAGRDDNARHELAKSVSNWVMTDVLRVIGDTKGKLADFPIPPRHLAEMISLIHDGTVSGKIAKEVFEEMLRVKEPPAAIVARKGLVQVSDAPVIERAVTEVLAAHTAQVAKYLEGNEKIFGFFVGETMKIMKGKANPGVVNETLKKKLAGLKEAREGAPRG